MLDFHLLAVETIIQALKDGKQVELPRTQQKDWEHKYITQINLDSREFPLGNRKNKYRSIDLQHQHYQEIAFNMVNELVDCIKKDGHDVAKITTIEGSISLDIGPKIWRLELRTGFNFTYPTQWP